MANAITPVIGTGGNDTLNGSATGEVISGRQGIDTVNANAGNDLAHGGGSSDLINGSTGDDVLFGGGGPGLLDMTAMTIAQNHMGRVTFISEGAGFMNSLVMYRIAANGQVGGVQVLFPYASAQGSGGNLIPGQSYVDVPLQAGEQIGFMEASNAFGRPGAARLNDPTATFELRNAAGQVASITDAGNPTLFHVAANGKGKRVTLDGRQIAPENDTIYGGTGNGKIFGGSGTDVLNGDSGNDLLKGGDANDTLNGGDGNDTLNGEAGDDVLSGGAANDTLNGGAGNDTVDAGSGDDTLSGGSGRDNMDGGTGADELRSGTDADTLRGGDAADRLWGDTGDDQLADDAGNDRLFGGDENDGLSGGDGDDRLDGGSGANLLSGGAGADTFVFARSVSSSTVISDYECGMDGIIFEGLAGTGLLPDEFRAKAVSVDAAGDVHIDPGGLSIEIANRFGVSDLAAHVWDSITFA